MAAKKNYYVVVKGVQTGLFEQWDDCKQSVTGYPNAQYKGFVTLEEAKAYMEENGMTSEKRTKEMKLFQDNTTKLVAYVDGSFSVEYMKYAFGCVFLLSDGRIFTQYGNGDNPQSLQHRNVTGEMLGAMYAVKTAILNGFEEIVIYYDYEGIEKWVTGAWKSKTEYTQKYSAAMRDWGKNIKISFVKVPAHSNVKYNELADQMAKKGITEAKGIPKVQKLEELRLWNE